MNRVTELRFRAELKGVGRKPLRRAADIRRVTGKRWHRIGMYRKANGRRCPTVN